MSKFVDCERDQAFQLSSDLRDWIPEDDLARFVDKAAEGVEMSAFKASFAFSAFVPDGVPHRE